MDIHQLETSSEKDKTENLSWTQEMDNCLIEVLVVQAQLGLKVDKAFKGPAYTAACKEMNNKFGINCTTQHIKNRLKTIKKNFATLRELMRNSSGFSWNDMSKTFDAEPVVWKTYIDIKQPGLVQIHLRRHRKILGKKRQGDWTTWRGSFHSIKKLMEKRVMI